MNAEELKVEGRRSKGDDQRVERAVAKLLVVFTPEQLEQLAELFQVTHDQALIRETRQTLTVVFNEKGHPREFNGSNNVIPVKPVMYKAE